MSTHAVKSTYYTSDDVNARIAALDRQIKEMQDVMVRITEKINLSRQEILHLRNVEYHNKHK